MRFIFTQALVVLIAVRGKGEMTFLNEVEQGLKDTRTFSRAEPGEC